MNERDPCRTAELLLQSDRDYFAAGAEVVPFRGGKLLRMPGLERVPAGCVAVPDQATGDSTEFVAEAVSCASEGGASQLRFYTRETDDFAAFGTAGLRRSVEQGYVAAAFAGLSLVGVRGARVVPVRDSRNWIHKLHLAAELDRLPDGKQAAAADWTELERRKCQAGYMKAFLIELDGETCGAFAIAKCGPLSRLKNLVVHPRFRGRGVGRAAVAFALEQARAAGLEWLGAFALAEGGGRALYERCGFAVVTRQVEWSAPLTAINASAHNAARRIA